MSGSTVEEREGKVERSGEGWRVRGVSLSSSTVQIECIKSVLYINESLKCKKGTFHAHNNHKRYLKKFIENVHYVKVSTDVKTFFIISRKLTSDLTPSLFSFTLNIPLIRMCVHVCIIPYITIY